MGKIRMGVIGLGLIGPKHINGINSSLDAELTAISDINADVLDRIGYEYNVPASHRFTDYIKLLQCDDVDAVSICTPNSLHYKIVREAIRYNKPFALEKPVTSIYSEAEHLKQMVHEKNIRNMICFSYRFKPAARFARWLINEGHLGRIYHVYVQYLQGWGIDEATPLIWKFRKEFSGSGVSGDLGCHMIDMTRFLAGEFVKVCGQAGTFVDKRRIPGTEEFGSVDVDDYCNFMAELEGGISATFNISRFAFGRGNYQRIEVYGSNGGLVYSLENEDSIEVCIGNIYSNARDYHKIPVPLSFQANQMQAFFDILNGNGDGLSATIDDGCTCQKVLDAVIASFETNKWITLKGRVV